MSTHNKHLEQNDGYYTGLEVAHYGGLEPVQAEKYPVDSTTWWPAGHVHHVQPHGAGVPTIAEKTILGIRKVTFILVVTNMIFAIGMVAVGVLVSQLSPKTSEQCPVQSSATIQVVSQTSISLRSVKTTYCCTYACTSLAVPSNPRTAQPVQPARHPPKPPTLPTPTPRAKSA